MNELPFRVGSLLLIDDVFLRFVVALGPGEPISLNSDIYLFDSIIVQRDGPYAARGLFFFHPDSDSVRVR